jgi:hypothetical protein
MILIPGTYRPMITEEGAAEALRTVVLGKVRGLHAMLRYAEALEDIHVFRPDQVTT